MSERAFPFLRVNEREGKPRTRGIIENVKTWRTDAAAKIIDALGPPTTRSLPGTSRTTEPR
jgi:hypothetical protein